MRPHCCAPVCSMERWRCCTGCCARGRTRMQVRWHLTCMLLSMDGLYSFQTVAACGEMVGMLPDLQLLLLPLATALPRLVACRRLRRQAGAAHCRRWALHTATVWAGVGTDGSNHTVPAVWQIQVDCAAVP